MNFAATLTHSARAHPRRPALVFQGKEIRFDELNLRVNRFANGLRAAGLTDGEVVAIFMSNRPEAIEAYWAAAKVRLIVIPLNSMLQTAELAGIFELARVRCCVVEAGLADRLPPSNGARIDLVVKSDTDLPSSYEAFLDGGNGAEPAIDIAPEDLCTVMFSSGTTSRPKGITNTQRARAVACHIYATEFGLTFDSRTLHVTPLYHNSALILSLPTLAVGGCVVLERQFDPDRTLELCTRHQITHTLLVPTQLRRMLADRRDGRRFPDSLHCLVSVGEPLPESVRLRTLAELTPNLYTMYGISEGLASVLRPEWQATRGDTVGVPVLYTDIRIADESGNPMPPQAVGEIVGRSARQMSGYFRDPEATAATLKNGWIHTGDLGTIDNDGFLRVVGRKKDMIISGGVNIYPIDIEQAVLTYAGVAEAAVVGVADDRWGEVVKLVVVPAPGADLSVNALQDWCHVHLPGYQRPKLIEVRPALPRNATGKVLKQDLVIPFAHPLNPKKEP